MKRNFCLCCLQISRRKRCFDACRLFVKIVDQFGLVRFVRTIELCAGTRTIR